MDDRFAIARGLEILGGLYSEYPSLPLTRGMEINLHLYGSRALDRAEQIRLAEAVIYEMDEPEIHLHLVRSREAAWLHVRGDVAGVPVTVVMWADDVCERMPDERRKRDRWVLPPALVLVATRHVSGAPGGAQ
jgi:hypothetical protein